MNNIKKLIKSYEAWVVANPETVGDLETTTKWVSYFIAGRISNSNVVSELVYSLSNMLVLYNDRILETTSNPAADGLNNCVVNSGGGIIVSNDDETEQQRKQTKQQTVVYRLKVVLTTLEYCEVFIEISARRLFGQRGRWLFIVMLQVAKAAGRFFILKHSTEQIITSPALPSLNRRALIKSHQQQKLPSANGIGRSTGAIPKRHHHHHNKALAEEHNFTFQLKRSGRVVRKVEGAPPLQFRDFKILSSEQSTVVDENGLPRSRSQTPTILMRAEYLYIAKPLIHLAALGVFGQRRWGQYALSLALDIASIRMYHANRHLMTKQQKLEMSRRCINLLLYLMRSPFYELYTQTRLEGVLGFIADNVPLVRMIAGPLKEYIPHWQNTYFYLWST